MSKPHLIDDVEPVRQTALPTSSEVARKRALDKVGKSLDWFNQKMEELRNEHGESCCENCSLPETKKLPSGQLKKLTIDTKSETPRLVCTSCANKMYKQQQRDKVNSRNDREGVETGDLFWARERKKLTPAEKLTFEERDEEVVSLWHEIKLCLNLFWDEAIGYVKRGVDLHAEIDDQAFREFTREVCRSVVDDGTVLLEMVLIDFFRPSHKAWYDDIQAQGADKPGAVFLRLGYLTALPDSDVHKFLSLAEKYFGLPVSGLEAFGTRILRIYDFLDYRKVWKQPDTILHCSTSGCKETTVHDFSKNQYLPPQCFCVVHQKERDVKARTAFSAINKEKLEDTRADRTKTHDRYGRPKDEVVYGEDGRPYVP